MGLNWANWIVWGAIATAVLTILLASSQRLGFTRMSLPFLTGTMFTPSRDRAKLIGTVLQFMNGWVFALVYFFIFHVWGAAGWWRGALLGLLHALIVLAVVMPLFPSFHPRMAREEEGPWARRQLEPPGFFALHYGPQTPAWSIGAHMIFGALLGIFAQVR